MSLYLGNLKISNLGETYTPREIQSVNGKYSIGGNITIYGSDTLVSETDTRKIDEALSDLSKIDLSSYYKKNETSSAVEIQNAFDNIDMSDYYKKNETSSAIQLSNEFDNHYKKSELSVVNLSGYYEDGSEFSFDFIIKR